MHQGWIEQNPEKEVRISPAVIPFRELFREQVRQYGDLVCRCLSQDD
jgi:hypothetical protein